jgi:hypothetical protein
MLKDVIYSFNKLDYFYYFFIGIGLFIILVNTNVFNIKNIIPLCITIAIMFFLFKKKLLQDYSKMESHNTKLKKIQINKYPHLKQDIHIIDCIHKLQNLSYLNRLQFNAFLQYTDNFFRYYELLQHHNLKPTDIYDSAKDNSIRALNALQSFAINMNKYPYLETDQNISKTRFISENNNIQHCRDIFKKRFSLYLTEMEHKINTEWDKGNINMYSRPIYPDDADSANTSDVLYSDIYNIY